MTNPNTEEESWKTNERRQEELKKELRSLPGEIWRDFWTTVGFWTAMVLCWALITGTGAAIFYGIGGTQNSLWLGAAIVGGSSPILLGFVWALDLPRRVWRRITGKR
ncbi:hypothetical protein B9G55_00850 [Saccharibacillus sp. O16]|nr:hypothetical protein B9G55_00850 [Saccharibacillus sp. O16]